jgi:VWFA-related protein
VTIIGGEGRGEKRLDESAGQCRSNNSCAEAHHVEVIVFNRLTSGIGVVAHGGADTRKLVRRHRDAGTAATHDDAAVHLAVAEGRGHRLGNVGVVHGRVGMRSNVENLVSLLGHGRRQVAFQFEAGMVGPDGDSHVGNASANWTARLRAAGPPKAVLPRSGPASEGGDGEAAPAFQTSYTVGMQSNRTRLGTGVVLALVGGVALVAQAPSGQPPPATNQQPQPTFRRTIDFVTMDAIVRNERDQFVADLTKDDFEIFEDGVKQTITSMQLVHGGRVHNLVDAPPPPTLEGIILPPSRPRNDTAGRIFLIIVDDLHLDFRNTGRIRDLFKRIHRNLIHEGDMFAIVSTGPSSIAVDPTYDRKILDDSIKKIAGNGLKPSDIIQGPEGAEGPSEVRYRAHVAFSTAYDMLQQMERIPNRRKAVVWVSNGYDFDPFAQSRLGEDPVFGGRFGQTREEGRETRDQFNKSQVFADADLARELGELTRTANRANSTIYTIDPRGLVAGADLDEQLDPVEYGEHVRKTQDSLRVLAEETGGIAVVNQNDFDKGLKRIDAETSDYYMLGYTSSNPDPTKRTRKIEVKVTRPSMRVISRTSYSLARPPDVK